MLKLTAHMTCGAEALGKGLAHKCAVVMNEIDGFTKENSSYLLALAPHEDIICLFL